ncbi:MAG TPA: ATP-binding cassette domain-containing protein [Solirubrobacteraceae bacterium]|nr:ATP-binding cassette domain-containing protein [Solirubrobacteraceae bacterium]
MTGDLAIEVRDLHKRYGAHEAVRGIDVAVRRGEVFGLLGPNGAGKTTTVEILEGYRARDGGEVAVLGHDPGRRPLELRRRIGIVLQAGGIYSHITPHEALRHWAGLYPHPRAVEQTLELVGLTEKADARCRTLSGGQLRRLDFALALIGDPELIFLDEPTTGFDPEARRAAWETIRSLRALGKTILLTTHYLDEAQALADRVAIVKDGRILAIGPPRELGVGASHYRVAYRDGSGRLVRHETDDPTALLAELTQEALARGERLEELSVGRPSLEDVYLELTADAEEPPRTAPSAAEEPVPGEPSAAGEPVPGEPSDADAGGPGGNPRDLAASGRRSRR